MHLNPKSDPFGYENSYGVYIIHVIVMGAIALAMLNTAIPSLLKYFILAASTCGAGNLIVSCYRRVIKSKIQIKKSEIQNCIKRPCFFKLEPGDS